MSTRDRLRSLLRVAALGGAAGSALGCAHSTNAGGQPIGTGFDENACGTDGTFSWFSAFQPLDGFDSISVRSYPWPDVGDAGTPTVFVNTVGTPCASATDTSTCLAALDALPTVGSFLLPGYGGPWGGTGQDVLYTRGDEVGQATSTAGLAALLGTVDTAAEAALLAITSASPVYGFDCSKNNAQRTTDGYEIVVRSGIGCGAGNDIYEHLVRVSPSGVTTLVRSVLVQAGDPGCAIGRLTHGTRVAVHAPGGGERHLGVHLAEMAGLEAAAVFAFERLRDELRALGAPAGLVRRARAAAADERRHASRVGALARAHGAEPLAPVVGPLPLRGVFELALENAVEGMVRETFGAAVATYQAEHAADPAVASLFASIAQDETRHAALSLDLARWCEQQLGAPERAEVIAARTSAATRFAAALREDDGAPEALRTALGLPDASTAANIFDVVFPQAWAIARA